MQNTCREGSELTFQHVRGHELVSPRARGPVLSAVSPDPNPTMRLEASNCKGGSSCTYEGRPPLPGGCARGNAICDESSYLQWRITDLVDIGNSNQDRGHVALPMILIAIIMSQSSCRQVAAHPKPLFPIVQGRPTESIRKMCELSLHDTIVDV